VNIPPEVQTGQRAAGSAAAGPWTFIDKVYCINLSTRPDRKRSAQSEFDRVGLGDRVEWMTVEKHHSDTERGIFESHMACLRAGLKAGADTILVLEDDVILPGFSKDVFARVAGFISSGTQWTVLFLGGFIDKARRTSTPSVLRVKYRCSAHAYILHRRLAENMTDKPWSGEAYDIVLRDMAGDETFAVYPAFACQSSSPTDNDKRRGIDRVRRLIGGQRILQRWNGFSTLYFWRIVVIHVLILLGMVLFAVVAHRGHWFKHEPLDILFKRNGP
jgi:hypothetical protein